VKNYGVAACCFDQYTTTPREKQAEWAKRAQPTQRVPRAELIEALQNRTMSPTMFSNVLTDRELRDLLNTFIGLGLAARAHPQQKLFLIGHDSQASLVHDDRVVIRPDLTRSNLGEGDLSTVFAANALRREVPDLATVTIETVDTDVIAIALLHSFPGFFIHTRFQRKHHIFDIHSMTMSIPRNFGFTVDVFVLLAISRGTDFNGAQIKGVGDWAMYMQSARGSSKQIRDLLLTIIEKAPRKATMHPNQDLKRVQWVFDYWSRAPLIV
jgi:hypothetical protein